MSYCNLCLSKKMFFYNLTICISCMVFFASKQHRQDSIQSYSNCKGAAKSQPESAGKLDCFMTRFRQWWIHWLLTCNLTTELNSLACWQRQPCLTQDLNRRTHDPAAADEAWRVLLQLQHSGPAAKWMNLMLRVLCFLLSSEQHSVWGFDERVSNSFSVRNATS